MTAQHPAGADALALLSRARGRGSFGALGGQRLKINWGNNWAPPVLGPRKAPAQTLTFDETEFAAVKWFQFSDIPFKRSDPHLRRFIHKLNAGMVGGFGS